MLLRAGPYTLDVGYDHVGDQHYVSATLTYRGVARHAVRSYVMDVSLDPVVSSHHAEVTVGRGEDADTGLGPKWS